MKHSSRIIIICSTILFLFFSGYLALSERRQQDYNDNKNWWTLYFENPADTNMTFTIENHSTQSNFTWQLLVDKTILSSDTVHINKGSSQTISLALPQQYQGKRIVIHVTSEKSSKDIYKEF